MPADGAPGSAPQTSRKAFVLYVWDNDNCCVVGLFRAVGPGVGCRGGSLSTRRLQMLYDFHGIGRAIEARGIGWPRRALPLVFDIAHVREFASSLRALYPKPRYAIRDWLAESLDDFLAGRHRCDKVEIELYKRTLADPFSSNVPSAVPILLGDYRRWYPSGTEKGGRLPGVRVFPGDMHVFNEKSGHAVLRKSALEADMRRQGLDPARDREAYVATLRAKGLKVLDYDPDLPYQCVWTAAFNFDAQELLLAFADREVEAEIIDVPEDEKELRLLLAHRCPRAEIRAAAGGGYYLQGHLKAGERATVWIGTHRLECLRVFGTDRLCGDAEGAS